MALSREMLALSMILALSSPARAESWATFGGNWYTSEDPPTLCASLQAPLDALVTRRGGSGVSAPSILSPSPLVPVGLVTDEAEVTCVFTISGGGGGSVLIPVFDRNISLERRVSVHESQGFGLFSFAFGTVIFFWIVSHSLGIILGMMRR